ncbi:hypothetical protein E2C01_090184 [Portunus trituberculatus]|uniref:Uncharacterized protein n=1 Tax=Portunus trituberculatus TaxID=210409 RepID=A0A5B7JFJ1_PORTR|nr:hypothetical protein [Portunus trituberculatus]
MSNFKSVKCDPWSIASLRLSCLAFIATPASTCTLCSPLFARLATPALPTLQLCRTEVDGKTRRSDRKLHLLYATLPCLTSGCSQKY